MISKLITIGIISEKDKKLDNQILANAIQKVAKNFGAFVVVDSNHEYEFHPEIFSALKKLIKIVYLIHYFYFSHRYNYIIINLSIS